MKPSEDFASHTTSVEQRQTRMSRRLAADTATGRQQLSEQYGSDIIAQLRNADDDSIELGSSIPPPWQLAANE